MGYNIYFSKVGFNSYDDAKKEGVGLTELEVCYKCRITPYESLVRK